MRNADQTQKYQLNQIAKDDDSETAHADMIEVEDLSKKKKPPVRGMLIKSRNRRRR